jgi:hypothetical protein
VETIPANERGKKNENHVQKPSERLHVYVLLIRHPKGHIKQANISKRTHPDQYCDSVIRKGWKYLEIWQKMMMSSNELPVKQPCRHGPVEHSIGIPVDLCS